MGMTADDEVDPGVGFCHFDVIFVAEVRKQDGGIPFVGLMVVFPDGFLRQREPDALQIVGMGVRTSLGIDLYGSDNAYLEAIDIEHLCRHDMQSGFFRRENVGTDVTETGIFHQRRQ